MEPTPKDAVTSLFAIREASTLASRYSPNNGIVLFVWAAVIFACLAVFDILPRVVVTGILCVAPLLTALWQLWYTRRLPVRPLNVPYRKTMLCWTLYHVVVIVGGTMSGFLLFHSKPPYMFTVIGLADATPLFVVA